MGANRQDRLRRTLGVVEPRFGAERYLQFIDKHRWTGRAVARFHETYDLTLTPTLACPQVPLGWLDTVKILTA